MANEAKAAVGARFPMLWFGCEMFPKDICIKVLVSNIAVFRGEALRGDYIMKYLTLSMD
jgi:hypothetical protein